MSSLLRQVALLAAGCQPWHKDVCAANGDRFAYCATMAVYIYELDRHFNEFKLHSIMSEHKKTITAISWSPTNIDLFASTSADNQLIVWNVAEQIVVSRLSNMYSIPNSVGWCMHEKDCVAFISDLGPLCVWNFANAVAPGNKGVAIHKETNFSVEVCMFRWHPTKAGKLAFGHGDGSMSFICQGTRNKKHVLPPEGAGDDDTIDPITALEWDPLSVAYLLTCNKHTGVRLIDTEAVSVIATFQLPSAATCVHTLAWISTAPGMFLTGDALTGVLRVWNVSKSTPIESIRLKKTGFHILHAFCPTQGATSDSPNSCSQGLPASVGSGSLSAGQYALPPAHVVCTFLDGGVGLYDLGKRRWNFLRDYGHIETIFDCQFKPDNPNLIATGSFDGTIKVWDVTTLTLVDSSPGNEGVIYSLSWAPGDLNCVAASTSKYGAFIWDINKGKVIKRFREHGKSSVYSVAWNQKDLKHIATCGGDGYCIVHQVDGKCVMKYKHPAAVFGCDWNPNNKDMIATGCDDKRVRIFYLSTTTEQPLKIFPGHTAKVFKVKWCPLREGILCSGSDDGTIRVWDYSQETCITTLHGHTAPVRGLLWNTEIPYLLISGSWDYSIRVWDTRDGVCLDDIRDHGADVYGLTCHSQRPFVMASCSRDSTMRIWSMAPLTQPLEISVLAGQPYDKIMASVEQAMSVRLVPQLCGRESRNLKQLLDDLPQDNTLRRLRNYSNLFCGARGVSNLWELVSVVCGQRDVELSPGYSKGIMHKKHITRFKSAEAQELEMVKMSKFGAGLGAPSKEERLREAADIHIRLGNVQKYCELMVELGQWEKALSVAPGVSLKYWRSLAQRRAESLMLDDSEDIIPLCTAVGNACYLVKFFTSQGQLQNAMVTAVAASEGSIASPAPTSKTKEDWPVSNGVDHMHSDLLEETSKQLADWYFSGGSGVLAACCHLAVDDGQRAMLKLLRSSEFELALSIGRMLKGVERLTTAAAEYLGRRCERLGRWDLAIDLLGTVTDDKSLLMAMVCARCGETLDEINILHEKAGFPAMDECLTLAESLRTEDSVLECVQYYLLSSSPELGLEIGLKSVKNVMSGTRWQADDVWGLLQLMASVRTEKLQQHQCSGLRNELMTLCAYVGALMAVRRGYSPIVVPLFKHVELLLRKEAVDLPLSISRVLSQMEAWQACQVSTDVRSASEEVFLSPDQQEHYDELMRRAGPESLFLGPDVVSSSHLPSHMKVYKSHLTGQIIRGPVYFLEDGRSAISISDAVMWAKVNPFSPFGSGLRINPF